MFNFFQLKDRIVDNQNQRPIPISRAKPPVNTYALLVGWGQIPKSQPPRLSNTQQFVYIWMMETAKCTGYYPQEHGQHICTSTKANIGVCPVSTQHFEFLFTYLCELINFLCTGSILHTNSVRHKFYYLFIIY